jgi:flagella basal body P-ring formation protein FlgA
MIRLLAALLLALTPAALDARPALKPVASVAGEVVTLGDLVEGLGSIGATPVFGAPAIGEDGVVQAWRILDAARAHGVEGIDRRGIVEVRVERAARLVSDVELGALVRSELGLAGTAAERVQVNLDLAGLPRRVAVAPAASLVLQRFVQDPATGRFEATLVAGDGPGGERRPLGRLAGTAIVEVDVVRLRRAVQRGEIVNVGDVVVERAPRLRLPQDVASETADVVGRAARRGLSEGATLRASDLERPRVIARNDTVTIVFDTGRVVVTARGQANDGGAVGDVIEVRNLASRRIVQAVVTGPGKVTVQPGSRPLPERRVGAAQATTEIR